MWGRINLRNRIYIIITSLILITLVGGLVMVWYTYRMEGLLTSIIDKNMAAFRTAGALEVALVNQKGFVSYYFMDGDPNWLKQLGEYRQIFKERLNKARSLVEHEQQRKTINRIDLEYTQYITSKDRVIELYKAGEHEAGARLHKKVRSHFFRLLDLCEEYKNVHANRITKVSEKSHAQAGRLRIIACIAMLTGFLLAFLLVFVLVKQILDPIHNLILEADKKAASHQSDNEINALSRSVHGLIEDVDHTQSELETSREQLLQTEKMAMVGKLAAGMAHSIRNPFTSIQMRLFSLGRTLDLSPEQKGDFEVISEEIRRIDTIVQNFLEFSRPPKLKIQSVSPSTVVDAAILLLAHRLKSYDVTIKVSRKQPLPETQTDPEQLKEVFVNLVVNACEAMESGGSIVIHEEETVISPSKRVVVIRLSDNGPGIPESIIGKIFQPFFTTKEEGSGLGLSITTRIIEEHRGRLDVTSKQGEGTTFIITLPLKES